jgi:tripartite-type tricarboxylate transporter receptor subunit TctC
VVERLNAAAREALATEKVRQRFDDLGQDIPPPELQTVAALAAFQKAEVERWTPLLEGGESQDGIVSVSPASSRPA